jgi:N-glycosylase/DNA lyase
VLKSTVKDSTFAATIFTQHLFQKRILTVKNIKGNMPAIIVAVFMLVVTLTSQSHAMNGETWYATCSQQLQTTAEQLKTILPEKKVAYRACKIEAINIYCDLNVEGDARGIGNNASKDTKEKWADSVSNAGCPTIWNIPFGGPYVFAVRELEKEGGPGLVESYLPASRMLKRVLQQKFKGCERERERLGLFNTPQSCTTGWLKALDD